MPTSAGRLARHLRTHGLSQTATEIARRARLAAYREQRLVVLLKDLEAIVPAAPVADLRLEDLASGHLGELAQLNRRRSQPQADRRFARYAEQGVHGFVAYRRGELIGYYWWVDREMAVPFADLSDLGLGIVLEHGDVYGSDFFILDGHRGDGVAGDILCRIESSLAERGYRRLWGYVLSGNRPARWLYSSRGYTPMWITTQRRVALLSWTTRGPS